MDLSLLQIGLAIVSAFFVFAGYMIVYENPMQSSSEMQTVATSISDLFSKVDSFWIEDSFVHLLPDNNLCLQARISPDYIVVSSNEIASQVTIPVTQRLWIVTENTSLKTANDWHQAMLNFTGSKATEYDPIKNKSLANELLRSTWNQSQNAYYHDPLIWNENKYIRLEKCILYQENEIDEIISVNPMTEFIIIQQI
jgi:hypothetical protein